MRIPRIYQNKTLYTGDLVTLDEKATHHVLHVLRLKAGYSINLFDGKGNEFSSRIHEIHKRSVQVYIEQPVALIPDSTLKIHLGQGISKSGKMDIALQKAVELGVDEITPLMTEFSAVKSSDEHLLKRFSHWQAIIINACEQCGRARLPVLNSACSLSEWLHQSKSDLSLVLDPYSSDGFSAITSHPSSIHLLIGPEGGLSEKEIHLCKTHQFKGVKLGPRILRTETATLAAMSILQSLWGDMG